MSWLAALALLAGGPVSQLAFEWWFAAALAGQVAGWFTIRARVRRGGEDHPLDLVLAWCLGVGTFWLSSASMAVALGALPVPSLRWLGTRAAFVAVIATLSAPVVLPVCYAMQLVVWSAWRRLHPAAAGVPLHHGDHAQGTAP